MEDHRGEGRCRRERCPSGGQDHRKGPRRVVRVDLEFHTNVEEIDVGYDGGVSTTPRYI